MFDQKRRIGYQIFYIFLSNQKTEEAQTARIEQKKLKQKEKGTDQIETEKYTKSYYQGDQLNPKENSKYIKVHQIINRKNDKKKVMKTIWTRSTSKPVIVFYQKKYQVYKGLDHINLQKIISFFFNIEEQKFCIVSEYYSGQELDVGLISRQINSISTIGVIFKQLLQAVYYLHSNQFIHGFINFQHILWQSNNPKDQIIKLINFQYDQGYILQCQDLPQIIFFPPEYFKNSISISDKSDVWSCGVILYFLLVGKFPFKGESKEKLEKEIIKGYISFDIPELDHVDVDLINLLKGMLEYNPLKRLNSQKCLNHKWIKNTKFLRDKKIVSRLTKMNQKTFQNTTSLHKGIMMFVLDQKMHERERNELRLMFKQFDKDNNNRISFEELSQGLQESKKFSKDKVNEIKELFKEIDVDNSGDLDYNEFMLLFNKKQKKLTQKNLKSAFKKFDQDGNGKVTVTEFVECLKKFNLFEYELMDQIHLMDEDKNGIITFDEFEKFFSQVFKLND